jgi:hypothetical protein
MDGISIPRAFSYKIHDGYVSLLHRHQMADLDQDDEPIDWKPATGPIRVLNQNVDLDQKRLRYVPKKPLPLDSLKEAINKLKEFDVIEEQHWQVMSFSLNYHIWMMINLTSSDLHLLFQKWQSFFNAQEDQMNCSCSTCNILQHSIAACRVSIHSSKDENNATCRRKAVSSILGADFLNYSEFS